MKLGRRTKIAAVTVMIALLVIGLVIGLVVGLAPWESSSEGITNSTSTSTTATTTASPPYDRYDSVYKQYRFAAVTTDTNICSQIGV